jgi:hypothetical protein
MSSYKFLLWYLNNIEYLYYQKWALPLIMNKPSKYVKKHRKITDKSPKIKIESKKLFTISQAVSSNYDFYILIYGIQLSYLTYFKHFFYRINYFLNINAPWNRKITHIKNDAVFNIIEFFGEANDEGSSD